MDEEELGYKGNESWGDPDMRRLKYASLCIGNNTQVSVESFCNGFDREIVPGYN